VVAPGIVGTADVPAHWGLLEARGDGLELVRRPLWQEASAAYAAGVLPTDRAPGTARLNREFGIRREDKWTYWPAVADTD